MTYHEDSMFGEFVDTSKYVAEHNALMEAIARGDRMEHVEDGFKVVTYRHQGIVYVVKFEKIDDEYDLWSVLDYAVGWVRNALTVFGVLGFCLFCGLYVAGFFDFYAEKHPDTFIAKIFKK